VPQRIQELLRLCLEKNVKNRRQTAADVRIDIDRALADPLSPIEGAPSRTRTSRVAWLVTAAAILGAVALGIPGIRHLREATPSELRVDISTPTTTDLLSMALSPNGQRIVFVASEGGRQKLWLRSMDSTEPHALAGTDGATFPFWSPNSASVGFFADSKLKRIDIAGGTVQTITGAAQGRGGTWNEEDTILFAESVTNPLMRVPAGGGKPVAVTRLQSQQFSHRFPRFLPGGRHFLYYVSGNVESGGSVYVGSLDNEAENHRLLKADTAAAFAAPGHVLFVRQGTIFAQRFDPAGLKLIGDPFPVSEKVAVDPVLGAAAVTASAVGAIAFRGGAGAQQLLWFDRSGNEVGKVGGPDLDGPSSPELSPDGQRLALFRSVNGNVDIWIAEVERGLLSRFTLDDGADVEPIWSMDGEIFFASNRQGLYDIYRKAVNGAGAEVPVLKTQFSKRSLEVSRDGRFLLYGSIEPQTGYDLWALPLKEGQKPFPVANTTFEEREGQFSPNGNWIAYRSNESGRLEVYVQAFPGPGEKRQVSANGGAQPRWSPDGKELFYVDLDGRLMAVAVRAGATGQPVETGAAAALFMTRIALATQRTVKHQYAVSHDGKRFLINSFARDSVASPITLILNWNPQQKK
jgi:Tol biopolymer transport system component